MDSQDTPLIQIGNNINEAEQSFVHLMDGGDEVPVGILEVWVQFQSLP